MKRATLLLLAACGATDPDIPQPDGPFVPGPVSIAITSRGAPVVNVPVIFQNADSTTVASTVTDFDGKATAEIDGDGFVTVIEPREVSAPRDILTTFAGVQGGDELHLDLAPLGPTDVTSLELVVTRDSPDPAGGYRVLSSCGAVDIYAFAGDPAPLPLSQLIGCGSTADFLVVSLDEFGEPVRSQFRAGVPLVDGSQQALAAAYVPFDDAMLEYRNIPEEVGFVGAYRSFARDTGVLFDFSVGVTPDAGSGAVPIRVPEMSGAIAVSASSTFPARDEISTQLVIDWEAAGAGDYSLDLGAALLPRFVEPPTFEIGRRTATWAEADGGTEPDVVRIRLQIYRLEIPVGTAWEWRLIGPRTGSSVTFPNLPVDDRSGSNFNPSMFDSVVVQELTTAKLPAGFDKTVRERGFVPFKDLRSGTSGRIVTQDLFEAEPTGEPEL
jgi:hypothetical protein